MNLDTAFYLGIADEWIALPDVVGGIPFTRNRPSKTFQSLGGNFYNQRAAKAPGQWVLSHQYADAATVRWLQHAASGLAGEVWLYDVTQAQTNMLDPRDVVGRVAGAPTLDVEGVPFPALATGDTFTRRLRAGVGYWFGGYTSAASGVTIMTYDLGSGPVDVVAPTDTGSRPFSTTFTPSDDVTVTFVVASGGGGKVTVLRLTEGSVDTVGFMPGENTPCRVSVADPSRTLNYAYADKPAEADYTVTLNEVG